MKISSKETYQDGRPMAWSGEFREVPESFVDFDLGEIRQRHEAKSVVPVVLVQGDPIVDDADFGEGGDSIFLSEIEQVKPGEAVFLVDGKLLLNDCLFDVEVS